MGDQTNNPKKGINRRTVLKSAVAASAAGFVGVPAFSGSAVAQSSGETLYLTDTQDDPDKNPGDDPFGSPSDDTTKLYEVDISGGDANLTELLDLTGRDVTGDGSGDYNHVVAIASSPDGDTIWGIDKFTDRLFAYDVPNGSFTDKGDISGTPGSTLQAAVSPGGQLYITGFDDTGFYEVDTSGPSATKVATITDGNGNSIKAGGSDFVFDSKGDLFFVDAQSDPKALYRTTDINDWDNTTTQLTTDDSFSPSFGPGLAIRDGGTGNLVFSDGENDQLVEIKTDGMLVNTYPLKESGNDFDHQFGDMTVGELETAKTCTDCESDGALAKYEFECVEEDADGNCIDWDFTLEDEEDGDENISYTSGSFESQEGEEDEPISVTFETEYCNLYALVKAGPVTGFGSVSFDGDEITVSLTDEFINDKNGKYYAISYVEFYCPDECVDFSEEGEPGENVTGINPTITPVNSDKAEIVAPGQDPKMYGAPNDEGLTNGCMDFETWGFADIEAFRNRGDNAGDGDPANSTYPQDFDFVFDSAISSFSLRMLDYGDFNPTKSGHHKVEMVAKDSEGKTVDKQVLEYYTKEKFTRPGDSAWADSDKNELLYDDIYKAGDACDAELGEPGNYRWQVSGDGIKKVELQFPKGYDPHIAFDDLCYTRDVPE